MVPSAADVLAVGEPLHETIIGADERAAESVRCTAASAQAAGGHALLDEDNSVAKPW